MKAVRYHDFGDDSVISIDEIDRLEPRSDEVLIETRAIGVNPSDVLKRQGLFGDSLPVIPGYDVAGVVERVGDAVTGFEAGDRVFGFVPNAGVEGEGGDRQGTYAEYVTARHRRLAKLPSDIPFDAGAGLPVVGITAWLALVEYGDLRTGGSCFVHGASGGVGHVAVQIAKATNAEVAATASGDGKIERVYDLGADVVFDYKNDLAATVPESLRRPPDVVLDHMADKYLPFDVDLVREGGRVVLIGGNHDSPVIEDLSQAMWKDVKILPLAASNANDHGVVLESLAALLSNGSLEVKVAATFDLEDIAEAQRYVSEKSFVGKVVLRP